MNAQNMIASGGLKCINLNQNRVGTKGVQLICEALRDNTRLESLFLNDTDGAYALSKLLVSSVNLKELHIA